MSRSRKDYQRETKQMNARNNNINLHRTYLIQAPSIKVYIYIYNSLYE